ncbi:MAG: YceI family protein [Ignavibacteriaceae bacterium]|nr:YceI family protein [Ignavibacteriaceae bacterium]
MAAETNVSEKAVWSLDPAHSKIQFSARHMVISEVTGNFNNYEVNVKAGSDFLDSEVEVAIDVNSIDTGIGDRDNHLKSADFFEAEKFPKILFKSTKIEKVDDEEYKLYGDFTIRDITKPIKLDVTYGGTITDPWGKTRAGFKVVGSINRFDYDLKWNSLIEAGGAVVGKTIKIECNVELVK